MKPVQPNQPAMTRIECACGWSRLVPAQENAESAARYHRIQVHNDLEAVRAHTIY